MTDSEWVAEWMRAWRSFPDPGDGNPWTAMLDHFTKSHPASSHQSCAEALDKISEQSRAFFDLGQSLASNAGEGWRESVATFLEELAGRLQDPEAVAPVFGAMSPMGYWRQLAGHGNDEARDPRSPAARIDQLLRMPGVGYTREHQEAVQELARLGLDYEQAYGEYAAYGAETARQSVERLQERLNTEFEEGDGPASIRALYDAWIACSEEVYAERVAAADYVKLHGRMVNALMAYRRQAGKIMDQWAKAANLPTREEVDALHRKLKDTQHQLRALKTRAGEPQTKQSKKKRARKKKRAIKQ